MNVTINGNIVTIHDLSEADMLMQVQKRGLKQYVGLNTDLSFPMTPKDHIEFAGQIHRANNENKLRKKLDTGNGKPDNTPPKGTPPRGGAGNTKEFVNTMAIAA